MKSSICIGFIICLCSCYSKAPKLETGHEGKTMPSINLLLLDSITQINTKTWASGKTLVLIDFSPYCPYCRAMTQSIIDDNNKLSEIQFILLSNFPINELKKYVAEYQLEKYPNVTVARDYESYFGQYYKSPGVPCTAIYGKDRLLKQVLMGKVNSSLIKDISIE